MRSIYTLLIAAAGAASTMAAPPAGYYDSLEGKQGQALRGAVKAMAGSYSRVTYGNKTWQAFEKTNVRQVNGRDAWLDIYSNNIVYLPDHDALNIEHSVANSWWGGKNGCLEAYSDLFHLNPSDQNANNTKSNYPPGEVEGTPHFDNGLLLIGYPAEGQGGGAEKVFEPADQFKGDFARAYFYIFTTYGDIGWLDKHAYVYGDGGELLPWAVELLLRWNREDPVDSYELSRNEEIFKVQKNRNPFIDYPQLAEYIWGDMSQTAFSLIEEVPAEPVDRPEAPVFDGARTVGFDTYARRWWDGYTQTISRGEGTLMLSIDGRDYFEPSDDWLQLDPAMDATESHVYKAYVEREVNGYTLRSAVASINIDARDPGRTDWSRARWQRVTSLDGFTLDDTPCLVLSANTLHPMSTSGGVTKKFMESAGFAEFDDDGILYELPANAAVVEFEAVGQGKHRLMVNDCLGTYIGSWNTAGKNAMRLDHTTYTPGKAEVKADGTFVFTFDADGSLQFNKTQPRFLNYSSTQGGVYLYRYVDMNGGWSSVRSLAPDDSDWSVGVGPGEIIAPDGAVIFDLNGRRVPSGRVAPGIYIVTGSGRSQKVIIN